jgi:hypothetical protein
MHLQVAVFKVQRKPEPFALNRAGKRRGDVEIQRVAKFILLRSAARFDAGRHVARVMASKTRLAERPQQIAQRFESQKVEALVGDLELRLLRIADLSADARLLGGIVRLIDGDVVFLLHALDQLLDQFFEFALHLHLLQPVAHSSSNISPLSSACSRRASIRRASARLRAFVPEIVVESALQKIVRERAEQVLHAHLAGGVGNVFAVADAFHKAISPQPSAIS